MRSSSHRRPPSRLGVHRASSRASASRRLGARLAAAGIEDQWGLVVNEAPAFDLLVVAFNLVGSREALARNLVNGFVIDAYDLEGWARAMLAPSEDETCWPP